MKKLFVFLLIAFSISVASAQSVNLKWDAAKPPSCGPITAYNVYRSDSLGGEAIGTASIPGNKIGAVMQVGSAAPVPTYTDKSFVGLFGLTKYYKVTAWAACVVGHEESAFSNETMAVIPVQVIIVNPPTALANQVQIP